ncbi:transaldolase [Xylariaceae sp. FL0255]|nr:transaldolase [Xylariaceae sp. FL0255]
MTTNAASKTLLDALRESSSIDCDTLDVDVAKGLGPFVDCTSNQAIAYNELSRVNGEKKLVHQRLIKDAIFYATSHNSAYGGMNRWELAVEVMMIKLALRIVPYVTGYSHVQTNPNYAYSKQKTVENGRRIVALFQDLDPSYDIKRVCIKIPATWEGMQACRELEEQGIATLATTMFCMEQAALAAHVGCTYIAPYVNELKVHFDPKYVDEHKAFGFCGDTVRYYAHIGSKTRVLPASLVSIHEVMKLAGVHHITVSPPLLAELAETPGESWNGEIGTVINKEISGEVYFHDYTPILEDEGSWRMGFTRSGSGLAEGKIIQALNIFCDKQQALESLAWLSSNVGNSPSGDCSLFGPP